MIAADIFLDGFFAAVAAVGFGAVSDPPMRAFPRIALLAAVGHALRFCLMNCAGMDIATASLCAATAIGFGSLWLGKAIRCPVYSYADHQRTSETELIRPSKVVIVEGILIFQDPTLRDMFDIKIFVETDADVRILRRALRDIRDRGRTLESVITQYLTTVKPMHEQYVEPSRKYADIIVLEGGHNLVALDMIMQRIASHIASED